MAWCTFVVPLDQSVNQTLTIPLYCTGLTRTAKVGEQDKPLIEWNNHMGCVTVTDVPGLKKYLMCVTDGWPTVAKMTSYIVEADAITGPWRMVAYMKAFGEQGYFLNFPSKFINPDGCTLWLCYSANFSPVCNGVELEFNPPGGRYGLCLHEVRLLKPGERPPNTGGQLHLQQPL